MEKKATVRVARLGSHTTMMGFVPTATCSVCNAEPPYVLFINDEKKTFAWVCETCYKKGYPEMYEETKFMDEIKGDILSIPPWSKGSDSGG